MPQSFLLPPVPFDAFLRRLLLLTGDREAEIE